MNINLSIAAFLFLGIATLSCKSGQDEPLTVGPEPQPRVNYLGRDSITTGEYRGLVINSPADEVYQVLEMHRSNQDVSYISAVNNYFGNVSDLKNRLQDFDWLVLDENPETPTGVQVRLNRGKVERIQLNQGTPLNQWPQGIDLQLAIATGDSSDKLFNKLVSLSTQLGYSNKFQRIVLGSKYTYALYDPQKAQLPWTFVFDTRDHGIKEHVRVHFEDRKVAYIIVDRFQPY
jgi:hypothetical protein